MLETTPASQRYTLVGQVSSTDEKAEIASYSVQVTHPFLHSVSNTAHLNWCVNSGPVVPSQCYF